jgi:Cu2+-exporting ATPase/Cu+-exporting ATPase
VLLLRRCKLKVIGVDCPTCVYVIKGNLSKLRGFRGFEVDASSGEAIVEYDDVESSLRDIYMAIRDAGYDVEKKTMVIHLDASPEEFAKIEEAILKLRGILDVGLNPATRLLKIVVNVVEVDVEEVLGEIKRLGVKYTIAKEPPVKSRGMYLLYRRLVAFALGLSAIILGMTGMSIGDASKTLMGLSAIVLLLSHDILMRGFRALLLKRPTMESLITLSSVSTFVSALIFTLLGVHSSPYDVHVSSLFEASAGVLGFIGLGLYLEERLRYRAIAYLGELERLIPDNVRVLRGGVVVEVSISDVQVGDIVEVKAGGKIPVDGIVVEGWGYVDESTFTGEPTPIYKKAESRDPVLAGSTLVSGYLRVRATRIGGDTVLAHLLESSKTAGFYKPSFQRFADRVVGYFTWVIIIVSISVFTAWFIVSRDPVMSLILAASVLVVACPCPLGVAIPLATSIGVILASRRGILIRRGDVFERVAKSNTIVFDKTGTLTIGCPRVVGFTVFSDFDELEVLRAVCSVESRSEHVLAQAIIDYCRSRSVDLLEPEQYDHLPGLGVVGRVKGVEVVVGNTELLENANVEVPTRVREVVDEVGRRGGTPVLVAINGRVLGVFEVRDSIRGEARELVAYFKQVGFKVGVMSGDVGASVEYVKRELGLDFAYSSLKPIDKARLVRETQSSGARVIYVGDGVNDAVAISSAFVGIAVGRAPDLAREAGDVVLIHDDLRGLKTIYTISKRVVRTAKENLFWALIYNATLIPIAAGILYPSLRLMLKPEMAAVAMVLSDISVILNSSKLLVKKT